MVRPTFQQKGYDLASKAIVVTNSKLNPPPGEKNAYEHHYKGTLYFKNKDYKKAAQHFQRAYMAIGDNFYFRTSYGLTLCFIGKVEKGLDILSQSWEIMEENAPEYKQEAALLYFFTGMANIYAKSFSEAVPNLKKAIVLQEKLGDDRMLSLFNNAIGYATLLDQGRGSHTRADIAPHFHVHTRDMARAKEYFEAALFANQANGAAWRNYSIICDSLNLEPKVEFDSSLAHQDFNLASKGSFIHLPERIISAFDLSRFDEVVMLLDNSGSMVQEKVMCQDTTRFAIMKSTAMELVLNMPDSVELGVGTIGGDCADDPRLWSFAGEKTRRDLQWDIEFLVPDGTTPLLTILQRSDSLFSKDKGKERAIFLVSDGANICSARGLDICEWVESLAYQNITIYILTFLDASFSNTDAFAEYSCLADKTGGEILYLDDLRCNIKQHPTSLIAYCEPTIPELSRVDCWGSSFENLWAIFPEQN